MIKKDLEKRLADAREKALNEAAALAEARWDEYRKNNNPVDYHSAFVYATKEAIDLSSKYTNEVLVDVLSDILK